MAISTRSGSGSPIRVVLVDDSALTLRLLQRGLAGFKDIAVVGTAADGEAALTLIMQTDPDVVCTDLQMPRLDGLGLVRRLMASQPKPVIVVSSALSANHGSGSSGDSVFELMRAGAIDVTAKPRGGFETGTSADYVALARRIRVAAGVSVFRRNPATQGQRPGPDRTDVDRPGAERPIAARRVRRTIEPKAPVKIIALGASTGGPAALLELLLGLPRTLPVPLVGVQHIADGFLPGLVQWLRESSGFKVEIANAGQAPEPGVLHLAPTKQHLTLDARHRFLLTDDAPAGGGHRPSVDRLFESIAARYGRNGLGVLLTGMGRDGADGLGKIYRAGGMTIAQDEASCVVFGMPAAAIATGCVQQVLPPAAIGPAIVEVLAWRAPVAVAALSDSADSDLRPSTHLRP